MLALVYARSRAHNADNGGHAPMCAHRELTNTPSTHTYTRTRTHTCAHEKPNSPHTDAPAKKKRNNVWSAQHSEDEFGVEAAAVAGGGGTWRSSVGDETKVRARTHVTECEAVVFG